MATLTENIQQAILDFSAIKTSLINKNLAVPNGTPTSVYASLIDSLDTRNIQDFQEWMIYGGLDYTLYNDIDELLASNDYDTLLTVEASVAYAAYLKSSIANKIKNNSIYLKKALLSNYSYMFINSSFDFDENIVNVIEHNPVVNSDNYTDIISCSSDRHEHGYCDWMAFNGILDKADLNEVYAERNIWSAFGANQWVQYKYNEPKYLYSIKVYSIRDNAPLSIKIEGSSDGENFTLIKEQSLSGIIGVNHYDEVICCSPVAYQYFRFTISDSVYTGTCNVGEIEIYTFK